MGVSGSGKSTVGVLLAQALGAEFLEGDTLHSAQNVARMAAGVALTDQDRQEWLALLTERIAAARAGGRGLVVACSALKRAYRDTLRRGAPDLLFVHLTGAPELLARRTRQRTGHYMPASLLPSQLQTLEPPDRDERALTVDVRASPQAIVKSILARLAEPSAPSAD